METSWGIKGHERVGGWLRGPAAVGSRDMAVLGPASGQLGGRPAQRWARPFCVVWKAAWMHRVSFRDAVLGRPANGNVCACSFWGVDGAVHRSPP